MTSFARRLGRPALAGVAAWALLALPAYGQMVPGSPAFRGAPAMPIKFECPHCHEALRVKDEFAGKRGPCPKCKKPVTVPAAAPEPAPPPPRPDIEAEAAAQVCYEIPRLRVEFT